MDSPKYKHDCENCIYLGSLEEENIIYDLYICPNGKAISTVIARFSSNGPDYYSGLIFAKEYEKNPNNNSMHGKILYECLKRAHKRGYER